MLRGKKILLGITGSIAAYKTAYLVRFLIKSGAEVKVIMTTSATGFISPLTLATLSRNPVLTEFTRNEQGEWNNHVELGLWADLMIVAPASANTISKMAQGACDNLLMATYLSARCPVWIAPAMDLDMYQHPSVRRNLSVLEKDHVRIIDAGFGELASGLSGQGRMAEPEELHQHIEKHFTLQQRLKGKSALVTAGPTQEPLDPVRFITNHSSGKMGYAIAERLREEGCEVTLISGPVQISAPTGIKVINVITAQEMLEATLSQHEQSDILVFCAAVADYRPVVTEKEKIKKKGESMNLELTKNPDIAKLTGEKRNSRQFRVGFALETEKEEAHALEKLKSKHFDMVVLNSLKTAGAGFGHETNKITIFGKDNKRSDFELKDKKDVARDIVNEIVSRHKAH